MMPLTYSISNGILLGMLAYVIINVTCGKFKKITTTMYILAALFILKFAFINEETFKAKFVPNPDSDVKEVCEEVVGHVEEIKTKAGKAQFADEFGKAVKTILPAKESQAATKAEPQKQAQTAVETSVPTDKSAEEQTQTKEGTES